MPKNKFRILTLHYGKLYKATVSNTMLKRKLIRLVEPNSTQKQTCVTSQLIFDKGNFKNKGLKSNICQKKKVVFSTNGTETIGYPQFGRKKNLSMYITPYIKINTKQIGNLCVKRKTIKLLKDNIEENIDDLGFEGKIFIQYQTHKI